MMDVIEWVPCSERLPDNSRQVLLHAMSVHLKPCPFCGGEGCVHRHVNVGYTDTFVVICLDCDSETGRFYKSEEAAVEAWNRRTKE